MILKSEIIEIGSFTKTHGIKGELNAILEDNCEILEQCRCIILEIDSIYVPYFIKSFRAKGAHSSLIMIEGVTSEIEAKEFVAKPIYILKKEYSNLYEIDKDNDFNGNYASEFIGYSILDENNNQIGEIIDIDDSTDNPLFIIDNNCNTIYIPIVDEFIIDIDDKNKIIEMSLPVGLVELNLKQ